MPLCTDTVFFIIYERLSVAKKHSQNLVGGGRGTPYNVACLPQTSG